MAAPMAKAALLLALLLPAAPRLEAFGAGLDDQDAAQRPWISAVAAAK